MIDRADVDGVAIIRLAHGPVNALDLELVREIAAVFTDLDTSLHDAVVLGGTGRAFSAGVDLHRIVAGGPDYLRSFIPALVAAFEAVFDIGKPVVAAVNGHAIAGGCILVSACDHRIMSAGRIGVTELLAGVPFPDTALGILTYAIGPQRARTAVMTGTTYEPDAALRMGMVDEIVGPDDLLDRAVASARTLARSIPPDTYRHTKRQLRRETNERIGRHAPGADPETVRLWHKRATDGWISDFMARVTGRRPGPATEQSEQAAGRG